MHLFLKFTFVRGGKEQTLEKIARQTLLVLVASASIITKLRKIASQTLECKTQKGMLRQLLTKIVID